MTVHEILEERQDLFIVQTPGGITTLPKTDYFTLKLKHFDGKRIFHDFGRNGAWLEETYDDGIFNCHHGEHLVQVANAEVVAKAVLANNYDAYFKTFSKWHGIKQQADIISVLLRPYSHRINTNKETGMYEIDDVFAVDAHGVARFRTVDGRWLGLCLVAKTVSNKKDVELPELGHVMLNEITQIILAKVLFLLFPKHDDVFLDQLPEHAKRHALHLIKTAGVTENG